MKSCALGKCQRCSMFDCPRCIMPLPGFSRCKGHEFMLHSFKKSSASPQQRSASMPRPVPEKPPVPSPDAADHKNLRVNGTSAAKRSRSSSRPRNHESLQRTTTKTLVKAGKKVIARSYETINVIVARARQSILP